MADTKMNHGAKSRIAKVVAQRTKYNMENAGAVWQRKKGPQRHMTEGLAVERIKAWAAQVKMSIA